MIQPHKYKSFQTISRAKIYAVRLKFDSYVTISLFFRTLREKKNVLLRAEYSSHRNPSLFRLSYNCISSDTCSIVLVDSSSLLGHDCSAGA